MQPISADAPEAGEVSFEKNLAALAALDPDLAQRLRAIERPHTQLTTQEPLDLVLFDRGLYERDARKYAEKQVEDYLASPMRGFLNAPDPEKLKGIVGDASARIAARLAADRIETTPASHVRDAHFLFIFGVGLGFQVPPLVEATKARVVVLIEPNPEFLWHSLHVLDWTGLFGAAAKGDLVLTFVTERDPAHMVARVMEIMRANNPARLDGTYFFSHYASSALAAARDQLRRDFYLAISGLGYFEDERLMTENSVAKLASGDARIFAFNQEPRGEPIFLVGSGPSLDHEIEFIRASRPRAILMSLGTGLRALLAAGIVPDLHIELENSEGSAKAVAASTAGFDTSGIVLLASLTVKPSVPKHFSDCWFFFREQLSSTRLFGEGFESVSPSGPTVANAGLGMALRLGFRELYLFGVDMGSKTDGRFHSRGSIYGGETFTDPSVANERLPGNFGGEAVSIVTPQGARVLDWSRHIIEGVLTLNRDARVFNCSDGVRIAGALPRLSRMVRLGGEIDRPRVLAELERATVVMRPSQAFASWSGGRRDALPAFARARALVEAELLSPEPGTGWTQEVFETFRPKNDDDRIMRSFLGGTMTLLIGVASWYDRHVADPAKAPRARRVAFEELLASISEIERGYGEFMAETDAAFAPVSSQSAA